MEVLKFIIYRQTQRRSFPLLKEWYARKVGLKSSTTKKMEEKFSIITSVSYRAFEPVVEIALPSPPKVKEVKLKTPSENIVTIKNSLF